MSTDNYVSTAKRMCIAAKILHENAEYYSCCYLSGYVVECFLKQILLCYGKKGTDFYSMKDIKKFNHKISSLTVELASIELSVDIPPSCRVDFFNICPTIINGANGNPCWHPNHRYGGHPAWSEKEYADQYFTEIESLSESLHSLRIGGVL